MAVASTPTLLSIDRFFALLGVSPAHANQGTANPIFPAGGSCGQVYFQHDWQAPDRVSREAIAYAIDEAEREIGYVLGYPVAPTWVAQEVHPFQRQLWKRRTPVFMRHGGDADRDATGAPFSVKTTWAKVISGGRRAVDLVGTATTAAATLAYSDLDADGYAETATVTLTPPAAMSIPYVSEIKAYYPGHSGAREWEIRPARTRTYTGILVTLTFWSWQLIPWVLLEAFPNNASPLGAIDLTLAASRLASVDVYQEYNDPLQPSAQFLWERWGGECGDSGCVCGGVGCSLCSLKTQDGCISIRDAEMGVVVPRPATYDTATAQWNNAAWSECRNPDQVKLWYYSGLMSDRALSGEQDDPLGHQLAQAIAWLATARLDHAFCGCANVQTLSTELRTDLTRITGGESFSYPQNLLDNPFGTKKGEVMAWQRIRHLVENKVVGYAI